MVRIVLSSGHGKFIRGASGYIDEVDEARRVVERTADHLRGLGADVITYHDDVSNDQDENLKRICDFHNAQGKHDLDISVHFNATGEGYRDEPVGCEVFYASSAGMEVADETVDKICIASGLKNRGPKSGSLYFLNHTNEVANLIEVCFVDSKADCDIYNEYFEDICGAIASGLTGEQVQPGPEPEPEPEPEPPGPRPPDPDFDRPTIGKGDTGEDVAHLQRVLGLKDDGDFGEITETQVEAFQAACGVTADGVVGPNTWKQVDALEMRLLDGDDGLPERLMADIIKLAGDNPLVNYSWPDRGKSPPGYIPGMALCFGLAVRWVQTKETFVSDMIKAVGNSDKDALAWYADEFDEMEMYNIEPLDRLRHLFVLLIGLGMRESSGKYCEGRDMSADNVEAETAEAGMFQSSWNFHSASAQIEAFMEMYWDDPNGFLGVFREDVSPSASNLDCYGDDDGATYQWLAKYCPAFAVMTTATGLRVIRQHWGPINRKEVDLLAEVDDLLFEVQLLVRRGQPGIV